MIATIPISPLSLADLARDYWGAYDAAAIAQLAPLAYETCYQPKFYKAPDTTNEVLPAYGYYPFGLKITPGSLIWGFLLPAAVSGATNPPRYNVQITDTGLEDHQWFDEPVPAYFLSNYRPACLSTVAYPARGSFSSFPNLLNGPYPVVGSGLFNVEFWETSGSAQRVELIFGVLEAVG